MLNELNTIKKYNILERGFFKATRGENYFHPIASFQNRKTKKRWGDEHLKLYTAAVDVHVGWMKVNCMGWYSTDLAFTQRKHDKFFKNKRKKPTKKPTDKEISERQVQLHANPWQMCSGVCDITVFIG